MNSRTRHLPAIAVLGGTGNLMISVIFLGGRYVLLGTRQACPRRDSEGVHSESGPLHRQRDLAKRHKRKR